MRDGVVPFLAALCSMAACDAPQDPPPVTTVRDSSGVRIVATTARTRTAASWTIGQSADWSIGEVEGDPAYVLSRVVGATELPDGSIALGNGGTNEVRIYGPEGAFIRSVGRTGQGPGEFEYLRAVRRCDEEGFVAFDLNWQVKAFDLDGTLVDGEVLTTPDGFSPYNLACGEGGRYLLLGWGVDRAAGPTPGFHVARDRLVLTTSDRDIRTDYGTWLVSERIGSMSGSRPHPAGRATVFDLHDDRVYVGSGERFEIQVLGLDGVLQSIIRGPSIPLEVTDSIKSVTLEVLLREVDASRAPQVRSTVAAWEWPASLPAYTALQVDAEGIVWARAYSADPLDGETWSLFDEERGYLGDLVLQPRQTLLEAGRDYVLVLRRDELDVEHVERYSLMRSAP